MTYIIYNRYIKYAMHQSVTSEMLNVIISLVYRRYHRRRGPLLKRRKEGKTDCTYRTWMLHTSWQQSNRQNNERKAGHIHHASALNQWKHRTCLRKYHIEIQHQRMLCRVLPSALPLLAVSGSFSCLWALLLHIKEGEADVAVVLMTMALTSGYLTTVAIPMLTTVHLSNGKRKGIICTKGP